MTVTNLRSNEGDGLMNFRLSCGGILFLLTATPDRALALYQTVVIGIVMVTSYAFRKSSRVV